MIVFFLNLIRLEDSINQTTYEKFLFRFERECDISNNFFELSSYISFKIFDKQTDVGNDPKSVRNDRDKKREIMEKFNELPNFILSTLVERSNFV